MNILIDLGTDLAFAFLVEKMYGQRIDPTEAVALISHVQSVLEPVSRFHGNELPQPLGDRQSSPSSH